jgi:AhpD family alkylhydroperoxidase
MRLPPPPPRWTTRLLHTLQRRRYGQVLEPTALWSYRPAAQFAFLTLFRTLRGRRSPLPASLRALVSLRVSQLTTCAFCVDLNASMLRDAGVSEETALALPGWRYDPRFGAAERIALAYTEAMTASPPAVDDALFERVRAAFPPEAIVELTAVIAFQNMSARFNAALQAQAYGFCALPATEGSARDARGDPLRKSR